MKKQAQESNLIDVLISGYRDLTGNKFTRANAIELLQRDAISTLNDYEFSNEIPDHMNLCLIESMDDARIFVGWMDDSGATQSNVIDTLVTLPVHSEMRIDHQADGDGIEYWVRTIDADELRNAVVTEHYY